MTDVAVRLMGDSATAAADVLQLTAPDLQRRVGQMEAAGALHPAYAKALLRDSHEHVSTPDAPPQTPPTKEELEREAAAGEAVRAMLLDLGLRETKEPRDYGQCQWVNLPACDAPQHERDTAAEFRADAANFLQVVTLPDPGTPDGLLCFNVCDIMAYMTQALILVGLGARERVLAALARLPSHVVAEAVPHPLAGQEFAVGEGTYPTHFSVDQLAHIARWHEAYRKVARLVRSGVLTPEELVAMAKHGSEWAPAGTGNEMSWWDRAKRATRTGFTRAAAWASKHMSWLLDVDVMTTVTRIVRALTCTAVQVTLLYSIIKRKPHVALQLAHDRKEELKKLARSLPIGGDHALRLIEALDADAAIRSVARGGALQLLGSLASLVTCVYMGQWLSAASSALHATLRFTPMVAGLVKRALSAVGLTFLLPVVDEVDVWVRKVSVQATRIEALAARWTHERVLSPALSALVWGGSHAIAMLASRFPAVGIALAQAMAVERVWSGGWQVDKLLAGDPVHIDMLLDLVNPTLVCRLLRAVVGEGRIVAGCERLASFLTDTQRWTRIVESILNSLKDVVLLYTLWRGGEVADDKLWLSPCALTAHTDIAERNVDSRALVVYNPKRYFVADVDRAKADANFRTLHREMKRDDIDWTRKQRAVMLRQRIPWISREFEKREATVGNQQFELHNLRKLMPILVKDQQESDAAHAIAIAKLQGKLTNQRKRHYALRQATERGLLPASRVKDHPEYRAHALALANRAAEEREARTGKVMRWRRDQQDQLDLERASHIALQQATERGLLPVSEVKDYPEYRAHALALANRAAEEREARTGKVMRWRRDQQDQLDLERASHNALQQATERGLLPMSKVKNYPEYRAHALALARRAFEERKQAMRRKRDEEAQEDYKRETAARVRTELGTALGKVESLTNTLQQLTERRLLPVSKVKDYPEYRANTRKAFEERKQAMRRKRDEEAQEDYERATAARVRTELGTALGKVESLTTTLQQLTERGLLPASRVKDHPEYRANAIALAKRAFEEQVQATQRERDEKARRERELADTANLRTQLGTALGKVESSASQIYKLNGQFEKLKQLADFQAMLLSVVDRSLSDVTEERSELQRKLKSLEEGSQQSSLLTLQHTQNLRNEIDAKKQQIDAKDQQIATLENGMTEIQTQVLNRIGGAVLLNDQTTKRLNEQLRRMQKVQSDSEVLGNVTLKARADAAIAAIQDVIDGKPAAFATTNVEADALADALADTKDAAVQPIVNAITKAADKQVQSATEYAARADALGNEVDGIERDAGNQHALVLQLPGQLATATGWAAQNQSLLVTSNEANRLLNVQLTATAKARDENAVALVTKTDAHENEREVEGIQSSLSRASSLLTTLGIMGLHVNGIKGKSIILREDDHTTDADTLLSYIGNMSRDLLNAHNELENPSLSKTDRENHIKTINDISMEMKDLIKDVNDLTDDTKSYDGRLGSLAQQVNSLTAAAASANAQVAATAASAQAETLEAHTAAAWMEIEWDVARINTIITRSVALGDTATLSETEALAKDASTLKNKIMELDMMRNDPTFHTPAGRDQHDRLQQEISLETKGLSERIKTFEKSKAWQVDAIAAIQNKIKDLTGWAEGNATVAFNAETRANDTETNMANLLGQLTGLNNTHNALVKSNTDLAATHGALVTSNADTAGQLANLTTIYNALVESNTDLAATHGALVTSHADTAGQLANLTTIYNALVESNKNSTDGLATANLELLGQLETSKTLLTESHTRENAAYANFLLSDTNKLAQTAANVVFTSELVGDETNQLIANELKTRCNALRDQINALVEKVGNPANANAASQATLKGEMSTLENGLKTLGDEANSLVSQTNWHTDKLRELPLKLSEALGSNTELHGQLTEAQKKVTDLQPYVGHAQGNATIAKNAKETATNIFRHTVSMGERNLKAVKSLVGVLAETSDELGETENANEARELLTLLGAVKLPTSVDSSDTFFQDLAALAPRIEVLQNKTRHHPAAIKTLKGEKSSLANNLQEANRKVKALEEQLPTTVAAFAESIVPTLASLLGVPIVDPKDAENNSAVDFARGLLSAPGPVSDGRSVASVAPGSLASSTNPNSHSTQRQVVTKNFVVNAVFAAERGEKLEKKRTLSLLSHAAKADIVSHPEQADKVMRVLVHVRDGGQAKDAEKNLIAMETAVGDAHVLVFRLPGDVLPTILRKDEDGTVTQILERSGDTTQLSDASRINNLLALVREARAHSNEKGASDLVNAVMSLLPSSTTIAQVLKSNMLDQKHPPVATATDIFDVARLMDMDIEFKPGIIRYSQVMTVPNVRIEDTSNEMIERTRYNNSPAIIYYEKFRHTLMGWIMGAGDKLLPINQETVLQSFPNAFLTRQFRWSDDRNADDGLNNSRNTLFSQTPDAKLFRVATNLEKSGFRTILFKPSDTEPEVAVTRNGKIQDPELFLRIFNGVRSKHIRDYLWPERAGRIKFMSGVRVAEFKDEELFEKPPTNEMREKIMGLFKT